MKKVLSLVLSVTILSLMLLVASPVSAGTTEYYKGTNCTEQPATGSVAVGNNGYYTSTTYTKFSEGEEATITIKVDEIGTDWATAGVVLVVNSNLSATLPNTAWQSPGEDGIFTYCFKNGGSDNLLGAVYRWANGSSATGAAAWINQPLSDKITFTIKNVNGVIAIYANDYKWAYTSSGYVIPDGYIGIATAAGAKVTVKDAIPTSAPYKGTNCTEQPATGSVLVGGNGYFTSTVYTKFSEGQEASITVTLDEVGSDWSTNGFALVVNSELTSSLTLQECSDGKDGLLAFMYHVSNSQLLGQKYSWGSGSSDTRWSAWEQPTLSGDAPTITFTVKVVDGVIHIVRGGKTWKFNNSGSYNTMTLSDGYIGIVTAANAKVTVQNAIPVVSEPVAPFTAGTAGILDTLVNDKQGLRFNHTLTTTVSGDAETVTVNDTTYTVSKIGMLVSKNADAAMTVGETGVLNGYVTKARDITVDGDQVTYSFSILVKNINKDNKATDIYARPYLECADGTILYGEVQVTNVLEMYTELSKTTDFDATVDAWMA